MTAQFDVPEAGLEEWLAVLKPYQRNALLLFLKNMGPEEAARKWLSSTGPSQVAPFGGTKDTKPFWDAYKAEFTRFLCDEKAYAKEKEKLASLLKQAPGSKEIIVSMASAAIGAQIGLAATLLTPAVAILLYTAGRMGINAYCKLCEEQKSGADKSNKPV